jgi:curved DNA-binding protein CbpA
MTEQNGLSRQDAALLLGVAVSADSDEVKRRYRLLARATHPDAGGDPDDFAQIQRAYERLIVDDAPQSPTQIRRPSRTPTPPPDLFTYLDTANITWDTPPSATAITTAEDLAAYLAQPGATALTTFTARSRAPGAFSNRFAGSLSHEVTAQLAVSATIHGANAAQITITVDARNRRARRAVRRLATDPRWIKQRRSTGLRLRCVFVSHGDRFNTAVHAAAQTQEILTKLAWPLTQWQAHAPHANGQN